MQTLVDVLRQRAGEESTPYIFLEDGEDDARSITARELDARARRVASRVLEHAAPGDRALIVAPPGLDYIAAFFGCLYAGVIAVPAYPPDPRRIARTLPRLQAIVQAAGATVALTTRLIGSVLAMPSIAVDEDLGTDRWKPPAIDGDTIAMLQFTSGSTAAPRGVILPHASLLANLKMIGEAFEILAHPPRVVSWLPPYHDMGLIGALLAPLYAGGQVIAMSPLHFLQRPERWLRAIERYRADVSGGPNFAYDLCARKVDPATVDLSSWQLAFDGAEVVRPSTIDQFSTTFAASGFRRSAFSPCYGLAETGLLATAARRGAGPTIIDGRVSSGRPAPGVELIVVAGNQPVADGVTGEIWLRGAGVGRGYWNADSAAFAAVTADGAGPYLRTGDLGYLVDGELVICGRSKDIILAHGRTLYPDDIERVAGTAHAACRPGGVVAFAAELDDREQLVVVQEVSADEPAAIRAAIMRAVVESCDVAPAHIVLVEPGWIPKTSSGKVQRGACREAWLAGRGSGEMRRE